MATTLKNITIKTFKGIDESEPVIIDFAGTDKNIVSIQGDQGACKTSTLEGILWLMGGALNVSIKEMFHDGAPIDGELTFEHKGIQYKTVATGDKISVKTLREGDKKDKWVNEAAPKDLLKTIFKTCSVNQSFRYEKSDKQVEWINELFPLPKEVKNEIQKYSDQIKVMRTVDRPKIGNEAKAAKAILENNPLYKEYQQKGEELEKEIKKLNKSKDIAEDLNKWTTEYSKYSQAQVRLESLKEKKDEQISDINSIENQINELKLKLELKKSELKSTEESIVIGEKYIEDNKKVISKYESAKKAQEDQSVITLRIDSYEKMIEQLSVYNEKSEEYNLIDSRIKQISASISSIKSDYIPPIDGIEIVHEIEMEDGEVTKEVGIYYNGHCIRTVSGSEYLTALIKIIRASGSIYVFIDDLATYGSETVKYISSLASEIKDEGGVIFASEMKRGSELVISLEEKI